MVLMQHIVNKCSGSLLNTEASFEHAHSPFMMCLGVCMLSEIKITKVHVVVLLLFW